MVAYPRPRQRRGRAPQSPTRALPWIRRTICRRSTRPIQAGLLERHRVFPGSPHAYVCSISCLPDVLMDPSDSYLASSLENGPLVPLCSAQIQCQTIDVRHSLTPGCSRRQQACSSVGDDVCIATRPQLRIPSPFACPGHYHVHYSMQSSKYSSRIPHPRRHHRPAPLSCARARHRFPLATSKCSSQLPNAASHRTSKIHHQCRTTTTLPDLRISLRPGAQPVSHSFMIHSSSSFHSPSCLSLCLAT